VKGLYIAKGLPHFTLCSSLMILFTEKSRSQWIVILSCQCKAEVRKPGGMEKLYLNGLYSVLNNSIFLHICIFV